MGNLAEDFGRLNKQQHDIIDKFKGASLIVAGPGTGKTRTVSVLIGKLLEKGIRLRELLALTFSSEAAEELKGRVLEYYPYSFDQCWISTFHSFCARILREQYHLAEIKPDFSLLTGFEEALLMDMICSRQQPEAFKEFGKVLNKRGFQQEVLTFISLLKSNLVSPDEFEEVIKSCRQLSSRTKSRCRELLNLFRLYEKELKKADYLDFRDLIGLTVKVLQNPSAAKIYQKKFKAVLVDEFQDTDPAQYLLLSLLTGGNKDIKAAVIGDPHQSIYRFRGADPSMMSAASPFKKQYKARVFPLKINYRSSKAVVAAANRIKWSVKSAADSNLEAFSQKEGFVKYFKARDEIDEARFIARQTASMVIYGREGQKYKPSDIAILVRNNYQIDLITEQLTSLHIPFDIAGDMKFFKSEEIIGISSLVKAAGLEGEEQSDAIKRAFTSSIFGIDSVWAQAVAAEPLYTANMQQLIEKLLAKDFEGLPKINEKVKDATEEAAIAFANNITTIISHKDRDIETLVSEIIQLLSPHLKNIESYEAHNILLFRSMIGYYSKLFEAVKKQKPLLSDLLPNYDEWLAYFASTLIQSTEFNSNGVKIMTIHQSKGLEFPIVFVCGLAEGTFPVRQRENILITTPALEALKNEFNQEDRTVSFFNPYPVDFEEHIEEERRLFFVALTRAKEGVFLTAPMKTAGETVVPAPFLKEIGVIPIEEEQDIRPLSISEFRTELTKLDISERESLEDVLQEAEKDVTEEMSIHGIRPRQFGTGVHDKVVLPEGFRFSANSIKTFIECPRKFFFQVLLRIDKTNNNLQLVFDRGNAFHACMEELHRPGSIWEKGKMPTEEDLNMIVENYGLPQLSNQNCFVKSQIASEMRSAIYNYVSAVYSNGQFPCRHTEGVEKPFSFNLDKHKIIGRFDRIIKNEDGSVIITDYKTSKTLSVKKVQSWAFPENETPTEIQMPLYLLACKKMGIPKASMSLIYIKDDLYSKKHLKMKPGYMRSVAFNMGSGPEFGEEVGDKMDGFEEKLKCILTKMTSGFVFESDPSSLDNTRTCKSGQKDKPECPFMAYCGISK